MIHNLIAVCAIACGMPLAGVAQEFEFDHAPVQACLAEGGGTDCIGRSADACMENSEGGYSTFGMVGCMDLERAYWDRALNDAFAGLVDAARYEDSATYEGRQPAWEEHLRNMQRAWIAYRDATCEYEALGMFGGTGEALIATGCLMRLTGEQALYLQSMRANG